MLGDEQRHGKLPSLGAIDRLIHEPARFLIMATLYVVESGDFTFLMSETGLTRGNLSSHMSKLSEAGYITIEKGFVDNRRPRTLLRITDKGREALNDYRNSLQLMLDSLLRDPDTVVIDGIAPQRRVSGHSH